LGTAFSHRYYTDQALRTAGLARYVADVGGTRVSTSLATRPDCVGARIPLRGEAEHCILETAGPPGPAMDPEDTAQILRDIVNRGLNVWNGATFRPLEIAFTKEALRARFSVDEFFRPAPSETSQSSYNDEAIA